MPGSGSQEDESLNPKPLYETSFEIAILPPGTKTQMDNIYFNLGALKTLWQNEHHQSFYFYQTGRFSGQRLAEH
jgi:hypothetical protein